ncbi:hypothetical protein PtB15_2B260 [Puccinia triticina]|nr:hypothetical protein PtB15_2B260 [Puccinia triticina]
MRRSLQSATQKMCALRAIVLNDLRMSEHDLRMILNGYPASLRTLQLCNPANSLQRPGLYRILTECISPALESLTLEVGDRWGEWVYPK